MLKHETKALVELHGAALERKQLIVECLSAWGAVQLVGYLAAALEERAIANQAPGIDSMWARSYWQATEQTMKLHTSLINILGV